MGTQSKPSTAFGLSLAGGILVVLAGIVVMLLGAALTSFIGGIGGIFGFFGIVWGILIIFCANLLRSRPARHVGLGVAIVLFSIFSWFGAIGGFFLGFVLSLVGGILAIAWNPGGALVNTPVGSSPLPTAGAATFGSTKFCTSCGNKILASATFCNKCGARQEGN
ncbi:MAG: zinc ribbon domain-containing protein [Thaumarchaeota archaeon]|nr:zinc ribbon domain-containing protein [Nitrososphaerota archaeon]